jgi:hypothetical protein
MSARTCLTALSFFVLGSRPSVGHADLADEPAGVSVSLRAQVAKSSQGNGAVLGVLTLNVPLERFARRHAKAPAQPAEADPQLPDSSTGAPAAAEDEPATAEAEAQTAEVPEFVLTKKLVRATLSRAWVLAGHRAARVRLDGLVSRARAAAALPELRLRAARVTDESVRLSPTLDDPYRHTQAGGTNLLFEGRATWKLDRLLFADEELAVERLRGEQARARGALAERVLQALFSWQRAELAARSPKADADERAKSWLLALEAELTLDMLTGGWFSAVQRAEPVSAANQARFEERRRDPGARYQRAGQDRQQAVDKPRHACRDTHHAPGPQAARRCAKGVSLTSQHSAAK